MSRERQFVGQWIFVAGLTTMFVVACSDPSGPPAVGTLERDRVELIAEFREPIVEMAVREGDRVTAGQLVVQLDSTRAHLAVEQAEGSRRRADAVLSELLRGTRPEEIAEAEATLAESEVDVLESQRDLDRAEALVAVDVEPQRQLDLARQTHEVAVARREAARAVLERLLNGATVEELDQARGSLAEASAAVETARVDLERHRIESRRAGRIDALPFEVGETPTLGSTVAVLLVGDRPYARVHVGSAIRPRIAPGDEASVKVEGVDRTWKATVRWVSAEASYTPFYALTEQDRGRLTYLAEIDLLEPDAADLPTGLPVEVAFGGWGPVPSGSDG